MYEESVAIDHIDSDAVVHLWGCPERTQSG